MDNVDIHSLYCPESPPTPKGNMWIFIDPDVDENKKYPHPFLTFWSQKNVDNVDNQMPSRFSPIFTTSPAPIVINKSPSIQFFNKKFSISSKLCI